MRKLESPIGQRFGQLVVLEEVEPARSAGCTRRRFRCRCDCGQETLSQLGNLTSGASRSCGHGTRERFAALNRTHGMNRTPEAKAWRDMRKRCLDPENASYPRYGGRGISLCLEWQDSFEQFLADLGPRPGPGYSLERIDNDGPYSPANCRWATRKEQARNKRTTRLISFGGETRCVADWARLRGWRKNMLLDRLDRGWSVERTLTTPPQPRRLTPR